MDPNLTTRRPIRQRSTGWAQRLAMGLANAGVSPNQVSIASVVLAGVGAACLILSRDAAEGVRAGLLVVAAACMPARLLCNMLDGMVAVEFGKQTKAGLIFNELPDRISDVVFLVAAGYAAPSIAWAPDVGWAAAAAALLTAYVRALGATQDGLNDFSGPFAKQQRMVVLAIACLASTGEDAAGIDRGYVLAAALVLIAAGGAYTAARRTWRLARRLDGK